MHLARLTYNRLVAREALVLKRLVVVLGCWAPAVALAQNCPISISHPEAITLRHGVVVIENASVLSPEQQAEISKASANVDDASEQVRRAYQNSGYFKLRLEGKTSGTPGSSSKEQEIVVDVLDPGPQYRLGDINFAGAHAFSESQLRRLFAIEPGDTFSRSVIETGLDKLHHLYGSQGYVNFTAFPDAQLNDDTQTANLTIHIDEGRQFHLRDIKVLGGNSEIEARVLEDTELAPGQVFNSDDWERSFERLQAFLPNAIPIVKRNLDERGGWVDVVLDFRYRPGCP